MQALIEFSVPAATFVLLIAVGLDLAPEDFVRLRRQWLMVLTGLAAPLVLLPPLALGLTWLFAADDELTIAVLLIAACPIGGISNTYSYLARASPARSVTLTGLSCALAGVTIPLVGRAFELALVSPFALDVPAGRLAAQVVLVLALPVAIGMGARRWLPGDSAGPHGATLQRLAFGGVAVVLLLIVADDVEAFVRGLSTTGPLAAALVGASATIGWMTAAVVTRDVRDRFTIAAEFATRNVGIATAVAVTMLGRVEFARFGATYFLIEVPLMLAAALMFRRWRARADARRALEIMSAA